MHSEENYNLIQYSSFNNVIIKLDKFIKENEKTGFLVFQVFQDSPIYGRLPVPNAEITVNGLLGDGLNISQVFTSDENGKTEPIPLPTVSGVLSLNPGDTLPYFTYNASVENPDYFSASISDIPIFDSVTSIQPVRLMPKINSQCCEIYPIQPKYYYERR